MQDAKCKIFTATRLYIGIRLRAPGLKYRVQPTLYPAVHPFRPFPYTSLRHINLFANLCYQFCTMWITASCCYKMKRKINVWFDLIWFNGEKIKTQGEKISYIFPQSDFCSLFSATIKIIGEKIWYYVPYCLHFFSKFPIILWNIVLALSLCHLSFLFPCPFFLFLLFCRRARVVFMIFFPHQAIFIPPPPGGGYFPKYRPLVESALLWFIKLWSSS